jgi:hypothetical protein
MKPGCYSGLRKPFPKELNLRLIFTLRPDFSEVCQAVLRSNAARFFHTQHDTGVGWWMVTLVLLV